MKSTKDAQTILSNIPIICVIKDKNGNLIKLNKKFNPQYIKNYFTKYSTIINKEDNELKLNKRTIIADRKIEFVENENYWYRIMKIPILDKAGNVDKIVVFCRNIENEMQENEKRNTYIAGIIHDLKNPIIAQSRILETIVRKDIASHNIQEQDMHTQMLCSSRNVLEMIVSISNTFKYDEGKIHYNFEKCNLIDIVKESCKELTHLTKNENELVFKINSKAKIVKADKMHLRRVISNLVSNAINYRKEHTRVIVEVKSDNENILFSVTNQGYHIKPEIQKDLFKKYVSKTTKFNSISTGLGLYIAKKIINAHHGNMSINSTKEGINTFGFSIPKASRFVANENPSQNEENINKSICF